MEKKIGKKSKSEEKENSTIALAKILMRQIDDSGEESAFWMVSCLAKLYRANPRMNLVCLMNIIGKEMPKSVDEYKRYANNTL